jgi:hypothetical protein
VTKRKTFDPRSVALTFWRGDTVQTALANHDVGTLFQLYLQTHPECTQTQLALLTEHDRSDISNWVRGARSGRVGDIDVLTRIADGLQMPDEARVLAGLAPAAVLMSSIRAAIPGSRYPADVGDTLALAATSGDQSNLGRLYRLQDEAANDIRDLVATAQRIDILAVRGLGLLGLNDSLLRTIVTAERAEPLVIRVLVVDAACDAATRRAAEIGESPESFAASVRFAEHKLKDLSTEPGIAMQAFRYASLPVWRIVSVDDTAFVSTYDEDWEGHNSPVHRIDSSDGGALFKGFRRMFNDLVATAEQFI